MTNSIIPNPAWEIVDSSKLDVFMTCKRKYFFEHILGWRIDMPAHDLHFGESWHKAREYQLLNGYEDIQGAFNAFEKCYREKFDKDSDEQYCPKDPVGVIYALNKFADERRNDLVENKLLFTETSGTVPIDDKRVLYYRMDSVLQNLDTGKYFSWDHKSAKRFSRQWSEKFQLSIQNGTYTHCLYCMFNIPEVAGVEFCGTAFEFMKRGSKDKPQGYYISFLRVPSYKTPDQMNTWLWQVLDLYNDLERELDRLSHCNEGDQVMMAFPMCTNSCSDYYGCAFHDYCISWQNPLQKCYEPPLGYRIEFWDPRQMETTNKKDLNWR